MTRFSADFYIPGVIMCAADSRNSLIRGACGNIVGVGERVVMGPPVQEIVGQICRRNPRYAPKAHYFVLDALHRRLHILESPRHVTGEELAESARQLAMDRFGLLARTVLEHWGIHSTTDIGEIVFLLVDHGVLTKQETDRIEDFEGLYSFEQVFEAEYPWGV